jgi:hypothetical protein
LGFITPKGATFFNRTWVLRISAPVWTWTSVRTFWITWTFVDTVNIICPTKGFTIGFSITLLYADVGQIGALVTTLFGNVTVTVLLEAIWVWVRDMIWAIGIT